MLKKWMPLVFLGLLGMFLSEFLIWNVFSFSQVLASGGGAVAMLLVGALIYIVLFVVFVDVIQRWRVSDFTGVLILGMIYGLLLEGIFATKVFLPGIGLSFGGLWFSSLGFTALSWHPLIDFLGGFIILGLLFKGEFNLGDRKLHLREALVLFLFSVFWFMWSYARWLLIKLPSGVPMSIQILGVIAPMIVLGLVGGLTLRVSKGYRPKKILGKFGYVVAMIFILVFALMRFRSLGNRFSFVLYLIVILFYVLLFVFYMKSRGQGERKSVYEKCFPIKENWSWAKYLRLVAWVLVFYVMLGGTVKYFRLGGLFTLLDTIFYVLFLVFSVGFVVWVLGRILTRR